jgi:hypothetical protein
MRRTGGPFSASSSNNDLQNLTHIVYCVFPTASQDWQANRSLLDDAISTAVVTIEYRTIIALGEFEAN